MRSENKETLRITAVPEESTYEEKPSKRKRIRSEEEKKLDKTALKILLAVCAVAGYCFFAILVIVYCVLEIYWPVFILICGVSAAIIFLITILAFEYIAERIINRKL